MIPITLAALAGLPLAGCGDSPGGAVAAAAYASLPVEALLDWDTLADGGEPALLAALAEVERRVPRLSHEQLLTAVLPALQRALALADAAPTVRARAAAVAATAAERVEVEPAVAVVATALVDADALVRRQGCDALARLAVRGVAGLAAAVGPLARATADAQRDVRLAALAALQACGMQAREAAAAVLARAEAAAAEQAEVLAAWQALRAMQVTTDEVREALAAAVMDARTAVAQAAAAVLGDQACHDDPQIARPAVDGLVLALQHTQAAVRQTAIAELLAAGPKVRDAAGEALRALHADDPDRAVRRAAGEALDALGLAPGE